jgi:CRP/FNR family transcriptional regulator
MKKSNKSCDLKSCFLCTGCLTEWLPALGTHRQNFIFKKGETIFSEGEAVKGIFFLYQGKVKVHTKWGSGKQLILRFAKEGDVIGYRGFGNEKIYPVSASALEKVNVCFIDNAFFETTLQVNHSLSYRFMQFYANELQGAEKRLGNLVHKEVKVRVAETLLMLKNHFGERPDGFIDIVLTKQDLASYAGTTYETYSRMINELVKKKIVRQSGKHIAIRNEILLKKLID